MVALATSAPAYAASPAPSPSVVAPAGGFSATDRDSIADPEVLALVDDQLAQYSGGDLNRARVYVLPITGGDRLYLRSITPAGGGNAADWTIDPAGYPIVSTSAGFDGAAPVVVKSNNAPGTYVVTYQIDDGPLQTFEIQHTN